MDFSIFFIGIRRCKAGMVAMPRQLSVVKRFVWNNGLQLWHVRIQRPSSMLDAQRGFCAQEGCQNEAHNWAVVRPHLVNRGGPKILGLEPGSRHGHGRRHGCQPLIRTPAGQDLGPPLCREDLGPPLCREDLGPRSAENSGTQGVQAAAPRDPPPAPQTLRKQRPGK